MTAALWVLLALFVLRVLGQGLVAVGEGAGLPPWEEWYSGLLSYRWLLVSQIAIVVVYGRTCVDFTRRRGFFYEPNRRLASGLIVVGSIYLGVMIVRYVLRMGLYPHERWTGGSLPIFFHWVLATFLLLVGWHHRRQTHLAGRGSVVERSVGVGRSFSFGLRAFGWSLVAIAVLAWIGYQLSPAILGWTLDARRPEYAVRIHGSVPIAMTDGAVLRADVYRPLRLAKTPTILVRIPFSKSVTTSQFSTLVGRFWAEHGYTTVIQGTRGRYESDGRHYPLRDEQRDGLDTLQWLAGQPWYDGRIGMWGGSAFGHTQWALADRENPGPRALMVQICSTDMRRMFYPGGAFSLQSALFWALRSRGPIDTPPDGDTLGRGVSGWPLIEADDRAGADVDVFNDWVTHQREDEYWNQVDGVDRPEALRAPIHLMAGWFDPFLPTELEDFARIRRGARADVATRSRLVIGPWGHAESVRMPDGFEPQFPALRPQSEHRSRDRDRRVSHHGRPGHPSRRWRAVPDGAAHRSSCFPIGPGSSIANP